MLLLQRRADLAVQHQHYCFSLHRSKFTGWAMGCRLLFTLQWSNRNSQSSHPTVSWQQRDLPQHHSRRRPQIYIFLCWSLSEENIYKPLKLLPRITIMKKHRDDSPRHFVYRLGLNANLHTECTGAHLNTVLPGRGSSFLSEYLSE